MDSIWSHLICASKKLDFDLIEVPLMQLQLLQALLFQTYTRGENVFTYS